jgi:hypothetical protein
MSETPTPEQKPETQEKETARRLGVEGVLARKYPELYQKLKDLSVKTGQSVLDLLASYTNWALELREYSTYVTDEDLKNVTPQSLYSALKLLLFFEERYIRLASYVNISTATAILDYVKSLYYPVQVQSSPSQPPPPLPLIPQQQSDRFTRLMDAILRAIEMLSMGSEDVRRRLAYDIAQELIKLSQPQPQGEKK